MTPSGCHLYSFICHLYACSLFSTRTSTYHNTLFVVYTPHKPSWHPLAVVHTPHEVSWHFVPVVYSQRNVNLSQYFVVYTPHKPLHLLAVVYIPQSVVTLCAWSLLSTEHQPITRLCSSLYSTQTIMTPSGCHLYSTKSVMHFKLSCRQILGPADDPRKIITI